MILYLILPALLLLVFYIKQKFDFWQSRGVPQNDQMNPMGDMSDTGSKYHLMEKVDVMYKKFKGIQPFFGLYAMVFPVAVVTDLDLLRTVLVKDFHNFTNRGMYHNEKADALTMNMFNIEGDRWRRIRTALTPTFTSGKIKGMFHIIEDKVKELVAYLEKHAHDTDGIPAKETNSRFTADVFASAAFGLETKALHEENSFIMDVMRRVFATGSFAMFRLMFLSIFPRFSAWMKLRQFDRDIEDFFATTVTKNMEYREKNNVKRNDFLSMLINLMKRGNVSETEEINHDGKLTFQEILAQAFLFFFAGYETSSLTMSFALYYLGKHPAIQRRMRDEIKETRAKHDGELNYEALIEMTYLNQVFNETLRIFPPVGLLLRITAEDYKVPSTDFIIPKGVMIQVPVHSIHNDPEYYPNPEIFDPERFTPEENAKRHPYAYLPFGLGPRNCIGMRFAQLQLKYALAILVETFELSVNPKTIQPLQMDKKSPSLKIKGGIWIDFKKL